MDFLDEQLYGTSKLEPFRISMYEMVPYDLPKRVASVVRCLHENAFDTTLSIGFVLYVCNVTSNSFYFAFKRSCGTTPRRYLSSIRVNGAVLLLVDEQIHIDSIAVAVGYDNLQTFRNVFKRLTGYTPLSTGKAGERSFYHLVGSEHLRTSIDRVFISTTARTRRSS